MLSFYFNDDVWKEKSGNYLIWDYMTVKGANYFAQKFHDQGIGALKTTMKTSGIELLTPNEFLDSPDKKQAYNSFEVKYTGLLKVVAGFANAVLLPEPVKQEVFQLLQKVTGCSPLLRSMARIPRSNGR